MISYEQESDVIRWGLNLLHGDPFSNSLYCGGTIQNDASFYDGSYAREGNFGTDRTSVENDEIIAHTLQEEFSELAIAEASGLSHVGESQASFLAEDWFAPSIRNYSSGNEGDQEEADDSQSSNSCSSPDEDQHEREEWSLELTDDFSSLDGEVGKKLNQMVPIRHVPRINGDIPSVDEATSDHQRLLDRLRLYDLAELKVQGDGNCQFRALSDQFYRTPEHHEFVRWQVINQLKSYPEIYEGYVPMEYGNYLRKLSKYGIFFPGNYSFNFLMLLREWIFICKLFFALMGSRSGEWGDHVTLQAAADSYCVKIFVITSFKDTCYIEILPNIQKSAQVIFLSFWAEVHYNSIYPEGDLPSLETKKKKRWWHFGNKY